jgi:phosphatidylserine synthase
MTRISSPHRAFHPANTLTYGSLLAGIAAVACAVNRFDAGARACVALAVVADTFDGRFARLFDRGTEELAFGIQLDSLSDAIAFGIAPAVCAALLSAHGTAWTATMQVAWWGSVAAYAACAITRLAFYNVTSGSRSGFIGLPVPVAALLWATVMPFAPGPGASIAVFATTAAAMVLPVHLPRPTGLGLAAFACWPLIVIALSL